MTITYSNGLFHIETDMLSYSINEQTKSDTLHIRKPDMHLWDKSELDILCHSVYEAVKELDDSIYCGVAGQDHFLRICRRC